MAEGRYPLAGHDVKAFHYQFFLLFPAQLFDAVLVLQRIRTRRHHILIHQGDRTPGAGIAGTQQVIRIVFFRAPRSILGDAGIQSVVPCLMKRCLAGQRKRL